ncbi:unnamed protein product, partial [marine sediment metagenome]
MDSISLEDSISKSSGRSSTRHRSSKVLDGIERSVHRSLLKGVGLTDEDLKKPLVAVANSWNEIVPGHIHLDTLA